ncbi:hypothetical protein GGF32_001860 [Allomyces javanicus]|nr:hypothetical protein GGF32_001856 [Allomyces javanicus]KAJ3355694.1 hypothetical protein GGF32_001860 [Allomyces javanicus]
MLKDVVPIRIRSVATCVNVFDEMDYNPSREDSSLRMQRQATEKMKEHEKEQGHHLRSAKKYQENSVRDALQLRAAVATRHSVSQPANTGTMSPLSPSAIRDKPLCAASASISLAIGSRLPFTAPTAPALTPSLALLSRKRARTDDVPASLLERHTTAKRKCTRPNQEQASAAVRMSSDPDLWPRELKDLIAAHLRAADPEALLRLAKASPSWMRVAFWVASMNLEFDHVENLESVVPYLSLITNVTSLTLTFIRPRNDELKAQLLAAIPRDKITVIITNSHLANLAPLLDWLPLTLEELELWLPTLTSEMAENLADLQTRLVHLKRLHLAQPLGRLVRDFKPLAPEWGMEQSKAPQLLAHLPQSLKNVKLRLSSSQDNAIAPFPVPPAVQTLIVHPIANPLVTKLAQFMPPRLRSLSLTGPLGARGWVRLAPALPESLTTLDLTWTEFERHDRELSRTTPEDADTVPLYHAVATRLRRLEQLAMRELDRGFTDRGAAAIVRVLSLSTRTIIADIPRVDWVLKHTPARKAKHPRCMFKRDQVVDMRIINAAHVYPLLMQAVDGQTDRIRVHFGEKEDDRVHETAVAIDMLLENAGAAGVSL